MNPAWRNIPCHKRQRFRERLSEAQNHRCAYCGRNIKKRATVDHIIPLVHGGEPLSPDNAVAACRKCNERRGSMNAYRFYRLVQERKAMNQQMQRAFAKAA